VQGLEITQVDSKNWKSEFLTFVDRGAIENGITRRYEIFTKDAALGCVMWKAGWRRYTFRPNEATEYDFSCLTIIAEFCKIRTDERKAKWGQQGRVAT